MTGQVTGDPTRSPHALACAALLADTYAEAVRAGSDGWIDVFSPVAHTHWLAGQIPNSVMAVQDDAAHFSALEILPNALTWIKNPDSSEWLRVEGAHQPALLA